MPDIFFCNVSHSSFIFIAFNLNSESYFTVFSCGKSLSVVTIFTVLSFGSKLGSNGFSIVDTSSKSVLDKGLKFRVTHFSMFEIKSRLR